MPRDTILYIFSFLDNYTIKDLMLPCSYYTEYLIARLSTFKQDKWYRGIYNNLYDQCFLCFQSIDHDIYAIVICEKCELSIDGHRVFPSICRNCISDPRKRKRGRIYYNMCSICDTEKVHLVLTSYS